jgi:excisionase family DNA binding protein
MPKTQHGRRFVADYLKIPEVARRLDISEKTARRYVKAGTLPSTFIGGAYRVTEEDLEEFVHRAEVKPEDASPKAQAPPPEPTLLDDLEGARRAAWQAAVEEAQRLRETAGAQMRKALDEWRASKKRGAPYATRRQYLDELGNLLQEVYDAGGALGWAYVQAALTTQGGSDASVPSDLREESREMDHFYRDLWRRVQREEGLSIRTGAAENAVAQSDPGLVRPSGVEERAA